MTDKLPANLLALFQPRPALRYLLPCDYAPEQRRTAPISGVARYMDEMKKPDPNYVPTESVMQMRERLREEKKERAEQSLKDATEKYKPSEDPQIRGDPYKTLFVSRLSYEVKESDLEREFGRFGPIERIRIVRSKDPKDKKPHRGYAFIVYEREKDMKAAYKETDGIRIKDRRVLVDVERGRTVKGWKPRRLGGGLGGRGYTKAPISRPTGPSGYDRFGRGGFGRGGFRGGPGGFRGGGFGGRGGFDGPRGPRGGIGYQGGGTFGERGGGGYQNGHHDAPPPNAPTGPGGGRFSGGGYPNGPGAGGRFSDRGGFGDRDRGFGDRGGGFNDRDRGASSGSGGFGGRDGGYGGRQNGDREGGDSRGGYGRDGGDRDRGGYGGNRYGGGDDQGRKRQHDGDGYGGGGGDSRRRRY